MERLGLDEVYLDVSDIIDFNQGLLNRHDLSKSFFHLNKKDSTNGFLYNPTQLLGHQFPHALQNLPPIFRNETDEAILLERLILGSHLAQYIRLRLENETGYTSTVGISTSKLLSKLVGSLNKPEGQTTLIPPYNGLRDTEFYSDSSNVDKFIGFHDIGKIPGIGFKASNLIRKLVLSRPPEFENGLIYGRTKESVTVHDVKSYPGMSPELLENILGGHGIERGIGGKTWRLINGIDNSAVQLAKKFPNQISMENSYLDLDTIQEVNKQLNILTNNLINRMHTDLLENDESDEKDKKRWIAMPKTIRLSMKLRTLNEPDRTQNRTFNRISKSCSLPIFVFDLRQDKDYVVRKLVRETLHPLFKTLNSHSRRWSVSLLNVCVTNIVEATNHIGKSDNDISLIFRKHEMKQCNTGDQDQSLLGKINPSTAEIDQNASKEISDTIYHSAKSPKIDTVDTCVTWEESEDEFDFRETCDECGAVIPAFAMIAHERFHHQE